MWLCQAASKGSSFLEEFHYFRGVKHIDPPILAKSAGTLPLPFQKWFAEKGWSPRAHQLELSARARGGENMLLIAPTGAGKTLGGFMASLTDLAERGKVPPGSAFVGVHTLYIYLATESARRRYRAQPDEAGLGNGPADYGGNPDR